MKHSKFNGARCVLDWPRSRSALLLASMSVKATNTTGMHRHGSRDDKKEEEEECESRVQIATDDAIPMVLRIEISASWLCYISWLYNKAFHDKDDESCYISELCKSLATFASYTSVSKTSCGHYQR